MISLEKEKITPTTTTATTGEADVILDKHCGNNDEIHADHVNSNLVGDQAEETHLIDSSQSSPHAVTIAIDPLDVEMTAPSDCHLATNSGSLCNQNFAVIKPENPLEDLETASQITNDNVVADVKQNDDDDEVTSKRQRDSQINRKISYNFAIDNQASNTLTSLFAHVDKVKREVDQLINQIDFHQNQYNHHHVNANIDNRLMELDDGESLFIPNCISNQEEINNCPVKRRYAVVALKENNKEIINKRETCANDKTNLLCEQVRCHNETTALIAIQHLIQRRNELKSIDQQMSNIMTRYLINLDASKRILTGSSTNLLSHNPTQTLNQLDSCLHNQHHQDNQVGLHDYFVPYEAKYEQIFGGSIHEAKTNGAIDLTLISNKMAHNQLLSAQSVAEVTKTASTNPFALGAASMKQEVKKPASINLKKSRLLAANLTSSDSNAQEPMKSLNGPVDNQIDQSSPLNLLKRYRTHSTMMESSSIAMPSNNDSQLGLDLQQRMMMGSFRSQPQFAGPMSKQDGIGSSADNIFSPTNSAVPLTTTQLTMNGIESGANSTLRPHYKKFRSLSYQPTSSYEQQCIAAATTSSFVSTPRHNSVGNGALFGARTNNLEPAFDVVAFRQQHQNQQLLSNYLHHQQCTSPNQASLITTASSADAIDYRQLERKSVESQESKFCNGPMLFSSDQATAYILATMQQTNTNKLALNQQNSSDPLHLHTPVISTETQHKMAYRCHVCGSGFEDKHRLQQHLSIHLNLLPSWFEEKTIKETMAQYESKRGDYLCTSCHLRFETTAEFDKHMHLHGDKPYFCELCNQDNKLVCFRYYRQLLTHLRSHCFLYSCRFVPECKQTSNRKDYLKLHILKHHLNNKLPEQYTICCQ